MSKAIRNLLLIIAIATTVLSVFLIRKREFPEVVFVSNEHSDFLPVIINIPKENQSLSFIAAHFPNRVFPVTEEKPKEQVIEVEQEPQFSNEIKYVSTIVSGDLEHYYFKLIPSGKLIDLTESYGDSEWTLLSVEENIFIIQNGPDKYKVLKK